VDPILAEDGRHRHCAHLEESVFPLKCTLLQVAGCKLQARQPATWNLHSSARSGTGMVISTELRPLRSCCGRERWQARRLRMQRRCGRPLQQIPPGLAFRRRHFCQRPALFMNAWRCSGTCLRTGERQPGRPAAEPSAIFQSGPEPSPFLASGSDRASSVFCFSGSLSSNSAGSSRTTAGAAPRAWLATPRVSASPGRSPSDGPQRRFAVGRRRFPRHRGPQNC